MVKITKLNRGLTLAEVLIASSIILVFVVALVSVYNVYISLSLSNADSVKAAYLAEEGIEAVKFLRDDSWSANIAPLSDGTAYYMQYANNKWNLTTSYSLIDSSFDRNIVFSPVSRDSSGNIALSGGSLDSGTRLATVTVSWRGSKSTTTKSVSAYVTNIFDN